MDIPTNPILWILIGALSLFSFAFCFSGFRRRNIPMALFGVGLGIPPFAITSMVSWAMGLGVVLLAWWLSRNGW